MCLWVSVCVSCVFVSKCVCVSVDKCVCVSVDKCVSVGNCMCELFVCR